MPKETEYFDSQASAAGSLGISVHKIRDAKRAGCKAFRSGRVYRAELLDWLAKNHEGADREKDDPAKKRLRLTVEMMIALARVWDAEVFSFNQYFRIGTAIVEASGNKEVFAMWVQLTFDNVFSRCPNIGDARKQHPKVMRWLEGLGRKKNGNVSVDTAA